MREAKQLHLFNKRLEMLGMVIDGKPYYHRPPPKVSRDSIIKAGRTFAICEKCGSEKETQIHHKDRNPFNNEAANLVTLCRNCHLTMHKR